jgi:hypothetical protein
MSEQCEIFHALNEYRQQRRRDNTIASTKILNDRGITFISKNNGAHLIVGRYNFWPSTGLFADRKTNQRGRGVFNLIKKIKQEVLCQNT